MFTAISRLVAVAFILMLSTTQTLLAQCHASSDANNDGMTLSVADAAYITRFLKDCGPAPAVSYSFDLNGDGVIDTLDLKVFDSYMAGGLAAFTPYGGYPVPCPCNASFAPLKICCCSGTRGNVTMTGAVDLSDLSSLVSYLTGGGYVLPCTDAANVNGSGVVDLSDLSALVSYLTGGGYTLPACP